MSNLIIIDRKHKRANFDNQWTDPMGVEQARREKARTIDIPKDSKNPIHVAIASMGTKSLLGRKVFCFNDRQEVVGGVIADIIPPNYIHIRNKGVFRIDDVVSVGG